MQALLSSLGKRSHSTGGIGCEGGREGTAAAAGVVAAAAAGVVAAAAAGVVAAAGGASASRLARLQGRFVP